jgi:hypothetical protein
MNRPPAEEEEAAGTPEKENENPGLFRALGTT